MSDTDFGYFIDTYQMLHAACCMRFQLDLRLIFIKLFMRFQLLLQIVNHGVQKELMQKMKDATSEFYNLPIEEKNKYAMASNEIQGYGKGYLVSEKQTLDKSDSLMLHIYPTRYRKLQFWPKTPEGFK